MIILSKPILPGTKAIWRGDMSLGKQGQSLLTMILVTTLYTVLHRLIGLKEARDSAPRCFRMRVIRVLFRCGGIVELWNTLNTSFTTEVPTCYQ